MATLNLRLDDDLDERLTREAEIADETRSELARAAIAALLEQRERQRFLAAIARAARERGGREAQAVAEEALPADNEALEIAEGKSARQPKAAYTARRKKR